MARTASELTNDEILAIQDISEVGNEKYFYKNSTGEIVGANGVGSVDSVFGRTGAVTAHNGDYTTDQVTEVTDKNYVTDAQLEVIDDAVTKSDYTPAHSLLVQQSGTGSPTSLQVGNDTIVGRLSGGASEIDDIPMVNLPISTATQTALDGKLSSTFTASQLNTAVTDNDVAFINGSNTFRGTQTVKADIFNDSGIIKIYDGSTFNRGVEIISPNSTGGKAKVRVANSNSNMTIGTRDYESVIEISGTNGSLTVNGQNRTSGWTSFTPTVSGSGGTIGSYSIQTGLYKVKGKSVECLIRIRFIKGTLTGNVQVPLPIVATGNSGGQFLGGTICNFGTNPLTASLGIPSLYVTTIQFTKSSGSALTAFTDLGAGTVEIGVNFTYQTT